MKTLSRGAAATIPPVLRSPNLNPESEQIENNIPGNIYNFSLQEGLAG